MVVTLPPLRWHACRQANGIAVEQAYSQALDPPQRVANLGPQAAVLHTQPQRGLSATTAVDGRDGQHFPAQRPQPGRPSFGSLEHTAIQWMHQLVTHPLPTNSLAASAPQKLSTLHSCQP